MATTWNATERELVEPFQLAADAFGASKLRLSGEDEYDDRDVRLIESTDAWTLADPQLLLVVDRDSVVRDTGIRADELRVGLSIRDRQLNLFKLAGEWEFDSIPEGPMSLRDSLKQFSHGAHLELCLSLFVARTSDRGFGVARERGHVLARKRFVIRLMPELPRFPKVWKAPEDFEGLGLHEDTVFYVEWLVEDLNAPPAEAVLIWLNERHKDQIRSFEMGGSSGKLLASELSAMILAEISAAVLHSDQEPDDPSGTIEIVADILEDATQSSLPEIRQRTRNHDGYSYIRAWCQQSVGVTDMLRTLVFLGGDG